MAPIPVYSASPINAAKAKGATADTAAVDKNDGHGPGPSGPTPASTTATATSQAGASQTQYQPPPPQPGARPSLPAQTGAPEPYFGNYLDSPLDNPNFSSAIKDHPLPPGPGELGYAARADIPPPPKAGETLGPEHTTRAPATGQPENNMPPPPPQMSYPAPVAPPQAMSRGTASAIPPQPQPQLIGTEADPAHPPGYRQDVNASEFNSYQRAAHNAYVSENSSFGDSEGDGGIWDQAKKWASAAGDSLAAAEHEVWKKINKE